MLIRPMHKPGYYLVNEITIYRLLGLGVDHRRLIGGDRSRPYYLRMEN